MRLRDERGYAAVVTAVLGLTLFAIIGLVIDGQNQIQASQRANNAAAEAARAAGQHIVGSALEGNPTNVNRSAAVAAARSHLGRVGVQGHVTIAGEIITIRTTVSEPTDVLSLAGVRHVTATGEAEVRIAVGEKS